MRHLTFLLFFFASLISIAQQGINYKAVISDDTGDLISNQNITVQFSILVGVAQTIVYTETHQPTTNEEGLIILNIGEGNPSVGSFNAVDWGSDAHFLNVQIDTGAGLTDMGTTEFQSVPYSQHAFNVSGLEQIDEGNGAGWRLIGRNSDAFGNIGQNATDLSFSNEFTNLNGAVGFRTFAIGLNHLVSGYDGFASGQRNTVTGNISASFGGNNVVSGFESFATGSTNNVSGDFSSALGSNLVSSNTSSVSLNHNTHANGYASLSANYYTKADAFSTTAVGQYNVGGGNPNFWDSRDPIFEVGIGSNNESRANAFTVFKDGNITAPALTPTMINTTGNKSLVTKEYVDGLSTPASIWTEVGNDIIYTDGGVGIGVNEVEPNNVLQIGGDILVQSDLGALKIGYPNNGNQWRLTTINAGADLLFRTKSAGATFFNTRMWLKQAGELLVGDSGNSGNGWLQIQNNSTINKAHLSLEETENDYARIGFRNSSSNGNWDIAGLASNTTENARLNFYFRNDTGAADRMTITGDGEVGINGIPTARLHIFQKSQAVGTGLRFNDGTANSDWDITHGFGLRFHYGGALRATISATTGAYIQSSDSRLKSDIRSIPPILNKVEKLVAKSYSYKGKSSQTKTIGFLAQEVKEHFPELVEYLEADQTYGVNYSAFSVVAIKAIQEQQELINAQNRKILNLESKMKDYEELIKRISRMEKTLNIKD